MCRHSEYRSQPLALNHIRLPGQTAPSRDQILIKSQMSFNLVSFHQSKLVKIPAPEAIDLLLKQSPVHAGQDRSDFRRATRADDSNRNTGFQLHLFRRFRESKTESQSGVPHDCSHVSCRANPFPQGTPPKGQRAVKSLARAIWFHREDLRNAGLD
jgi:hypothetical protein